MGHRRVPCLLHCRPLLRRQLILSTALWISTSSGQHLRRSGAAGCTTFADSRPRLPLPRTPTIAQMGSPIGKQVGPRRRRCGVAHTMVRAALVRDARQSAPPLLLMIAMRASPIGSLAGAPRRSSGAARTQEKAAHSRAEVVLEEHSSAVDVPRAGYG